MRACVWGLSSRPFFFHSCLLRGIATSKCVVWMITTLPKLFGLRHMFWACFVQSAIAAAAERWSSVCGQLQSPRESVKHKDVQHPQPCPKSIASLSLEWNPGIAGSFNSQMIQHCSQGGELRAVGNSELKKNTCRVPTGLMAVTSPTPLNCGLHEGWDPNCFVHCCIPSGRACLKHSRCSINV